MKIAPPIDANPAAIPDSSPFAVTILYADRLAGRYGKRVFDLIKSEFADTTDVRVNLWRLDFLQNKSVKGEIAADIETSDLIILSAPLDGDESPEVLADLFSAFSGNDSLPEILMLDSNERLISGLPSRTTSVSTCGARIQRSRKESAWRFASCS